MYFNQGLVINVESYMCLKFTGFLEHKTYLANGEKL